MTSPFQSLQTRLLAGHGAVYAAVLLAAFVGLDLLLRQAAMRQVDLRSTAEAGRILDLAARRKPRILQEEFDRLARLAGSDDALYRLSDTGGVAVAAAGPEVWTSSCPPPPLPGSRRLETVTVGGDRIRWTCAADAAGRAVWIARSLREGDALVLHARWILLGGLLASLVAGLAMAGRIAGRALARVEAVRSAAMAIASGDLSRRVPGGAAEDEIAALVRAFNGMLDRIGTLMSELRAVTDDIAHELRTPITRIRCAMEEQLAAHPAADWREAAAVAIGDCDRLSHAIDVMLRIARLEAGRGMPEPQPVAIDFLVRDAVAMFETVAEDRGIRLNADPSPGLLVTGDRSGLQRALANLVDNALKYTPAGGSVRVMACCIGDRAVIEVADTGVGIAAEDQPWIFDRFHRVGDRSEAGGVGLGLCLVRAIVSAHSGTVSVESAPGRGSTFTIHLPVADGYATPPLPASS